MQIDNGLKSGFYGYLTKPFKLDGLMTMIDAALAFSKETLIYSISLSGRWPQNEKMREE